MWLRIALALVATGALLQSSVLPVLAAQTQPNVALTGNVAPAVADGLLTPVGTADPSQQVTLVIGLNLPDPAGVHAAVAAVRSGRQAPLTQQQFVDQYAPAAGDYQSVVSWLTAQGLTIQTSPNRLIVKATGSLGQAARVFGVTVHNYSLNGRTYYANDTAPQIPGNLANIVQSVSGLDNLPTFNTMAVPASPGSHTVADSVYYDANGFTPLGIEKAYDVLPVYSTLDSTGHAVYGTGQTVDIVIWNSLQPSDIDQFDATYGLPSATMDQIPVDGPVTTDWTTTGGSTEATLDAEMVHSLAPGAAIDVFEAPSPSGAGLEEAVNEAVEQHNANVLTMSWGNDETGLAGNPYLTTMDAIFAQGAAEGMTLLAASGDSGEYQYNDTKSSYETAVSFPASDPYVTAVGGTALTARTDGWYGGETAWNATEGLGGSGGIAPAYSGSGGGFSTAFSAPSWQSTVDGYTYGYNGTNTDYNSTNMRGVPDLALNAGGGTAAYSNGNWSTMLGTSISSPSWAGLVALVDQAYAAAGQPPLGYFNPLLYQLGQNGSLYDRSLFHQVDIGDNDTESSGNSPFYAADGWNPVTGWGTPDFSNLFNYLKSLQAPVSPAGITASPAALPPDYQGTPTVTVTGTNTHFSTSRPTVTLAYDGKTIPLSPTVESGTSLTFSLPVNADLTYDAQTQNYIVGEGTIQIQDATDGTMTADLDFGAETATISPSTLSEGYSATTINISGDNSTFTSSLDPTFGAYATTVEVVNAADQTPALYLGGQGTPAEDANVTVSDYTDAAFVLPAGLEPGQYDVVVNDNYTGVSLSVPLTITPVVASSSGGGGGGAPPAATSQPVSSSTGSASVSPSAGGTVGMGTGATASIPAGALQGTSNATVAIQTGSPPAAPSGFTFLGQTYQFTVNGQDHYTFNQNVTLTFTFDPSKIPAGGTPAVYYYDDTTGKWINTGGTVSGDTITVTVDHFTEYAVMAQAPASAPTPPKEIFSDVAGTWAQASIDKLASLGDLTGYPDGTFRPDNTVTRAEFTTMLVKIAGLTPVTSGSSPFKDVAPAAWYAPYVAAAYNAHLVSGTGAGTFDPDATITRQEVAVITMRAMGAMHLTGLVGTLPAQAFTDQSAAASWAREAISQAAEYGLVQGYPGGTFQPVKTLTRAEGSAILVKFLGFAQTAKSGKLPE